MPLTPQDFVSKWKRSAGREKQIYQQHFLDLCELVGHPSPAAFDPTATRFGFEMGATKTSGGQGWADVAKLGYFGWEYKGKDTDLEKAYNQLLLYRDALHNPPLLVVSDINTIIIRTNYTNLPTRTITLTLDDLLKPEGLSDADKKKRTITNLYNARPTWLDLAHKRLDQAVFAAYGWASDLSDEEILEKLLALNLERSKAEVV